ncbi:ATPase inhibitor subunit zeta [Aurantimonas sp. Leaf443]|uniref:ATPase inhibitor subunit zeta n=1 Tax=Aurantimonas sp. Leaf443 TaxID=1736378 RepID=UPI0006F7E95A|nr:ATPase inhibitor subunit zeta [Aurantimonas sp. Leaf443]KQT82825.1 hypothetical protein ASG48_15165 [Aurantimonas sp. Leaf443]
MASMMMNRSDIAERSFLLAEERSFHNRAKVDREVGLWAAGRFGLGGEAAARYANGAVQAGVRSATGRGGFDHIAASIGASGINIEELRTRYAMALSAAALPPLAFAEDKRRTI